MMYVFVIILQLFYKKITSTQPCATHPLFLDNLHFEHFDKSVNLKHGLKYFRNVRNGDCLKKGGEWHTANQVLIPC